MARGQTPALDPETADKYRRVVEYRAAGLTFDEIAERTGYASRSGAKLAYDAALKWWGTESVENLRIIEGERLEQLWRQTLARILAEREPEEQLSIGEFSALVSTAVRISARKAALNGLDAPRQVEVAGVDGGAIQTDIGELFRAKLRELET